MPITFPGYNVHVFNEKLEDNSYLNHELELCESMMKLDKRDIRDLKIAIAFSVVAITLLLFFFAYMLKFHGHANFVASQIAAICGVGLFIYFISLGLKEIKKKHVEIKQLEQELGLLKLKVT